MDEDLLDLLSDHSVLSEDQLILTQDTLASYGGSVWRTLETLFPEQVNELWTHLAQHVERPFYRTGREVETLEEPIQVSEKRWESALSRPLALHHLALCHRLEGDQLCLLSVNPFLDITAPELWERANMISPTGKGCVRASVLPPTLFRRCIQLTYPEALYGPLTLTERLSIQGLVSHALLYPYEQHEVKTVEDGLITEADYATCLAEHLKLPLYDYTQPDIDWRILPMSLIETLQILPLRTFPKGIEILTATAPVETVTQQVRRQSGRDVRYHITTPSVLRMLLQRKIHA